MFGISMQHDFLYNETIKENIDLGRKLSDEEIISAAKIAQAHDFITSFPDGYEHLLSQKATNISGGQKQRLLIARAIAAKPEILVLDDSSSALDYKTDANLRRALKENLADTTVVTVAQRVSSVKDCDLILVLDEGKIIGLDRRYALELVQAGEVQVEYDKIIDRQLERAAITSISGFGKIMDGAVKVLEI